MKAVVYSIKTFEKEFLSRANQKKHDITLISNPLSTETAVYARGKDAVIVNTDDDVSAAVINLLADMGIKYIGTRSVSTDHIDRGAAGLRSIKVANVPQADDNNTAPHPPHSTSDALQAVANQTIKNLDLWQQNKCVGKACACAKSCQVVTIAPPVI